MRCPWGWPSSWWDNSLVTAGKSGSYTITYVPNAMPTTTSSGSYLFTCYGHSETHGSDWSSYTWTANASSTNPAASDGFGQWSNWSATLISEGAKGHAGVDQVAQRGYDAARCKITVGVVVTANDHDPRMVPAGLHEQIVQHLEVVVIAGDQHAIPPNRVSQVQRIDRASQSNMPAAGFTVLSVGR
jgi:hypothetical protein